MPRCMCGGSLARPSTCGCRPLSRERCTTCVPQHATPQEVIIAVTSVLKLSFARVWYRPEYENRCCVYCVIAALLMKILAIHHTSFASPTELPYTMRVERMLHGSFGMKTGAADLAHGGRGTLVGGLKLQVKVAQREEVDAALRRAHHRYAAFPCAHRPAISGIESLHRNRSIYFTKIVLSKLLGCISHYFRGQLCWCMQPRMHC